MASENSNVKKAGIAIALLIVAGGLAYSRMQKFTPGPAINNGMADDFGGPDQRAQFQEVAKEAKITPEQQKKLDEARDKGDWGQMRDILTTDQRQIVFQKMRAGRTKQDTKMKAALGSNYDRYQEKRRESRGGRGGPGGGGGGTRPGGDTNRPAGGNRS